MPERQVVRMTGHGELVGVRAEQPLDQADARPEHQAAERQQGGRPRNAQPTRCTGVSATPGLRQNAPQTNRTA